MKQNNTHTHTNARIDTETNERRTNGQQWQIVVTKRQQKKDKLMHNSTQGNKSVSKLEQKMSSHTRKKQKKTQSDSEKYTSRPLYI